MEDTTQLIKMLFEVILKLGLHFFVVCHNFHLALLMVGTSVPCLERPRIPVTDVKVWNAVETLF